MEEKVCYDISHFSTKPETSELLHVQDLYVAAEINIRVKYVFDPSSFSEIWN